MKISLVLIILITSFPAMSVTDQELIQTIISHCQKGRVKSWKKYKNVDRKAKEFTSQCITYSKKFSLEQIRLPSNEIQSQACTDAVFDSYADIFKINSASIDFSTTMKISEIALQLCK